MLYYRAACAMAVRVGHFADPDELPGLAHFLEHVCCYIERNWF